MPLNEAERAALDKRLLAAHSDGDFAALIALYLEAAARVGADEAQGFYLTHAYVFALGFKCQPIVNAMFSWFAQPTPATRRCH